MNQLEIFGFRAMWSPYLLYPVRHYGALSLFLQANVFKAKSNNW